MKEKTYKFYYELNLEWYESDPGNKRIGKEQIHLSTEELAALMGLDPCNYPFSGGMYSLKIKKEIAIVQKFVQHKIDLSNYEYFITTRSLNAEHTYEIIKDTPYWIIVENAVIDLEEHEDLVLKRDRGDICGFITQALLEATGKIKHISSHKKHINI